MNFPTYTAGASSFIYVYNAENIAINIDHTFVGGGGTDGGTGGGFIQTRGYNDGAAIATTSKNVDVVVSNSTFQNITMNSIAGGSLFYMDQDYAKDQGTSSLTLTNNYFCNVVNSYGAAGGPASVATVLSMDHVTATGNHFNNNTGVIGGVMSLYQSGYIVSSNNIYQNNRAKQRGGAVSVSGTYPSAAVDQTASTFTNDKFYTNFTDDSVLGTAGNGGAIFLNDNKVLQITSSEFVNNYATSPTVTAGTGNGGAVFVTSSKTTTIRDSKFCGNYAKMDGGAINASNSGTLSITNGTFNNNYQTYGITNGGGAIWSNGSVNANGTQFYSNYTAGGVNGGAVYLSGNYASTFASAIFNGNNGSEGGAIYKSGGNLLTVGSSYFVKNAANNSGGFGYGGGAIYLGDSGLSSTNNIYDQNTTAASAGAVYVHSPAASQAVTINGDKFYNNSSAISGGALHLYNGVGQNVAITNSEFGFNKTNDNVGAAMYVRDAAQVGEEIDSFTGNKLYGNSANGSTTSVMADIYLQNDGTTAYATIGTMNSNFLQLSANTTNYRTFAFSTGFHLGSGNTQQTTALSLSYTLPTAIACSTVPAAVCATLQSTIPPYAAMSANDVDETATGLLTVTTCAGATATINFRSDSGVPPLTFTYIIQKVNTATAAVISTSAVQTIATAGNSPTVSVTTEAIQSGVTYNYIVQSVTDANGITTNYTCSGASRPPRATVVAKDCACYNAPSTAAGLPTNHGITALGRAGVSQDNWPMVRTSAHTVLEAKTKGLVITRMTTSQVNGIVSPQEGMIVYDTDAKCLKLYDGSTWSCYVTPACP